MSRSSWLPSIVVDNVGGLRPLSRKAELEHPGVEKRRIVPFGLSTAFRRKKPAAMGTRPDLSSSDLRERAEVAAKQMRYFGLVAQKSSFSELLPSARRAGFALLSKYAERREATFQWAIGQPDFIFSVSFEDPERVCVFAESRQDIFGLVLVSYSHVPNISAETMPSLANHELGRNALRFRKILLTFPDFDGMAAWAKY
jgi:hypothetical protein